MKSHNRVKHFGEVFTPHELVTKMLDELPQDVWSDPAKTIGDLAGCGNGNFLVEVIKRKIEHGSSPLQALNTTFGIDIMQDNVDECKERLLSQAEMSSGQKRNIDWVTVVNHNVICGDALTFDWNAFRQIQIDEKYNVIKSVVTDIQSVERLPIVKNNFESEKGEISVKQVYEQIAA